MARSSRRKSKLLVKATELSLAAPQVRALRTAQMFAAGANPSAADRRENLRMVHEKYAPFGAIRRARRPMQRGSAAAELANEAASTGVQ